MVTFIMIHGAWHGGWCFDPLRRLIAPDLPGMGGTDQELASVTLAGWADFVADIVREQPAPVILCGHSRGGIVISEVAERVPEHISALVYICAMLLPDGMSRGEWRAHAEPNPAFMAIQKDHPSGHARVIDPTNARAVFAQLSPTDQVAAALSRLKAEPEGPRRAKLHLTSERYGSVPRHYIECLHDLTIPLADQRLMQSLTPCDSVISLAADHSPYLSTPRELADALISIAERIPT
jgi:pimeloyl-ACP methyl ester carboxylesterase